jgi:hypothetical protein
VGKIIFKPINGNESLNEISNDNGVRVVNIATSKNLVVKSTMFVDWYSFEKTDDVKADEGI